MEADNATSSLAATARRDDRFGALLLVSVAMGLFGLLLLEQLGLCAWPAVCAPLTAADVSQARLDTALPAPQGEFVVEQTFVPRHDGLSEIELLLVRYGETPPASEAEQFTVELWDSKTRVAARTDATARLAHNQPYRLAFAPLPHSAGRLYTLRLLGSAGNPIAAWGYSLDVYEGGALTLRGDPTGRPPAASELRFATHYSLTAGEALAAAMRPLRNQRDLLLAALLLLPLPGVLLLLLMRPRGWDGGARAGVALALGIAVWPLVWHWLTLAGWHWTGGRLWAAVGVGWVLVVVITARRLTADRRPPPEEVPGARGQGPGEARPSLEPGTWPLEPGTPEEGSRGQRLGARKEETRHPPPATRPPAAVGGRRSAVYPVLLALLLAASLAARFIAVRDLAFPPWVDSSRHALITTIVTERGQTLNNYAPYLPVNNFPYHFGFHTVAASLALMTGRPVPEVLLTLGQLVNGLLPLTVYAAAWLLTRRRAVALLAAFLVALPFFFPGYYATWGRYTHLTAMAVMPVLLALTWRLGRGWPRFWPLVGVLAAGVFIIHFRVFLFYLPFAALTAAVHLIRRRRWKALALAAALALLLVLPRLIELATKADPAELISQTQEGFNDFPIGYVTAGWERLYLGLAAAGALVVLVGAARRRRWATVPLLLLLWVGALFLLLSADRLGLPETLIVNLSSMYISLFLPLSLFLALVAGAGWRGVARWLRRTTEEGARGQGPGAREEGASPGTWNLEPETSSDHRPSSVVRGRAARAAFAAAGGLALALLLAFGWRQQANIINPQTVLAMPEDMAALAWMDANLPADGRVAVNAWQWSGLTWAGSDGGAWVVPLTGRAATALPIDYIYNQALFDEIFAFNTAATAIEDWGDPAAADWLRQQGVTHVYVGQRGGFFDPAELLRNPALTLLFRHEGTFVFAVEQDDR